MTIWRMHLITELSGEDEPERPTTAEILEFCKSHDLIGVGWCNIHCKDDDEQKLRDEIIGMQKIRYWQLRVCKMDQNWHERKRPRQGGQQLLDFADMETFWDAAIGSEEPECLVMLDLQSRGYYLDSSTIKLSTGTVEASLVAKDGSYRAYPQVERITRKELEEFMQSNRSILPETITVWLDLLGLNGSRR